MRDSLNSAAKLLQKQHICKFLSNFFAKIEFYSMFLGIDRAAQACIKTNYIGLKMQGTALCKKIAHYLLCPAGRDCTFGGFLVRSRIRACRRYNFFSTYASTHVLFYKKQPFLQKKIKKMKNYQLSIINYQLFLLSLRRIWKQSLRYYLIP